MGQRGSTRSKITMIIVLMGVSGSGKTTLGSQLAAILGWQFIEGDDFHPVANVRKMSRGEPLTDSDRNPWLTALRQALEPILARDGSAIVTCSALKQDYRDRLQEGHLHQVKFVYLRGSATALRSRLSQRSQHFMPARLLNSQLETLEEPQDAFVIDIDMYKSTAAQIAVLQGWIESQPPQP